MIHKGKEFFLLISSPRIPTPISATVAVIAFLYDVIMVFVLHRHEEYWALIVGLSFAIYPLVPKLPEEPDEVKPEKYSYSANLTGLSMTLKSVLFLMCFVGVVRAANADDVAQRRSFVERLAKDITRSGVKKVYVADFTDGSGKQFILGRFFAGTFSGMLEESSGFTVVSRINAHRYLSKSGRTDQDLAVPDVLAKLVSDMGADAILWGKVSVNQGVATIDVMMRDVSGKHLFQAQYVEKLNSELRADLDAIQTGSTFYYVGVDGVSFPKCLHCPVPEWPVGQGSPSREGNVVLSVLVTLKGKADQMSVVETLNPVFDRAALECVRTWRFEPAKDADGNVVPVRLPVQLTFKMRWQVR
jgi:TonB family protein